MIIETISVDRRADYYERAAPVIAADPLGFYCRAERGRRWQAESFYTGNEYARTEMLDAAPSTDHGDYFEEIGYGY